MPAARDWEDTIRAVVSHALSQKGCRRGWTVLNHRGHARLNIAAGAGRGRRRQVLLPIPWECDQIDHIRDAVVQVYEEFQQGIEPDACVARMPRADGSRAAEGEFCSGRGTQTGHPGRPRHRGMAAMLAPADWEELIAAFREHKLISGEIKPSTWHRVYRHHMNHVRTPSSCWRPWRGSGRTSRADAPARFRFSRLPPCCVGPLRSGGWARTGSRLRIWRCSWADRVRRKRSRRPWRWSTSLRWCGPSRMPAGALPFS
jgi:hypothetical protein